MNANATLVAFYGKKPEPLAVLVDAVQKHARQLLGNEFAPYPMEQVHATIVGLEGARNATGDMVNANFLSLRAESRTMQLPRCLEHLQRTPLLPFTLRFGGFQKDAVYPFTSRGEHPFARSFTIQGTRAVLMGWPVAGQSYPLALAHLRRELEAFGVLHKYHAAADALDNDAFMVVGQIRRTAGDDAAIRRVIDDVRTRLAGLAAHAVVDASSPRIVSYVDPALPLETSTALRLSDALRQKP
jgi:hypothetical protein